MSIPRILSAALLVCAGLHAACTSSPAPEGETYDAGVIASGDAAQVETCSFENCNGCCDGNTCVEFTDEERCGQPGARCQACSGDETCVAGSCVEDNSCDDCEGCCFEGVVCLEGNAQAACGSDGASCTACPVGQGCSSAGECVDIVCDASNCDGCCTANGECISTSQQTTAACGEGGNACEVCDADAVACTSGTCVIDQPCLDFCDDGCCNESGQCIVFEDQDEGTCGAAESCSACDAELSCVSGSCTPDPAWTIVVRSAIIDATNSDGDDWDQTLFANPLPDPYAMGALGDDTFLDWATSTIDNTLTPNWQEMKGTYLQSDLLDQGFYIEIRDSDGLGIFERIGTCMFFLSEEDLLAGEKTRSFCGGASQVRLGFVQL